jgi:outer membrane receptor protein involved in Fe transport
MKTFTRCALLLLAIQIFGTVPCFAQASSSTAELRGQVLDPSGAALTGANVSLADLNKGTKRTVASDDDGFFTFLNLPPSNYELVVEATGFASNATRIDLTVGQQANVPIKLEVGTVTETVSVLAGSEVVEIDRTQQSSVVDDMQIANLPISRRNYLDYALLTPGVTDSDNIADASDFRVVQTQQSGLSFGGNNGRGNLIAVDGGETNTASGGVQAAVGQEAVQEFQVLRNSFNAEFGGASGGIVNIVSKSGANAFHGSVFGLFRNEAFDARNAFDFNPDGKSPFDRQQFGGSFGGPIDRDETFFFTSVERFSQNETTFVNLLNDPNVFGITASQDALFDFLDAGTPFAALSGPLRVALTTSEALYPRTVALFEDASGQFPFESNQTIFTARVDHVFSDEDTGNIRFNHNDSKFENNAAGALTAVSRGRTLDTFNGGILLSEYHRFSDTLFNEVKAQFTYLRFNVIPNDLVGPEINIEGFGFFGRDIFLPSATIERHYDVVDNVSLVVDTHTYKFGGSVSLFNVSTANETFFGGRFNFGTAIPLINLVPANLRTPLQGFLTAANPALLPTLAAPINSLQSYNLNLPIVYQQGFGTSKVDSWTANYAFYGQDTWKVKPNFTLNYGLRYSVNDEPFYLRTDTDNFQPRGGFSWDPFGDGKTAIRGGAGIFAGYTIYSVPNVTKTLSGLPDDPINIVLATATSTALGLPSSFAIYQTLLAQGVIGRRPITAADLAQFGVTPRPGAPLEVRFRIADDYETPTTYQASFGVQRDLGEGFSLDVSYLYTRGLHLTRNRDVNQFKQTGPVNPFTGQRSFIRFPTPEQVAAGLTSDFRNPLRLQDNVYESTANSFYHALTVSVQRRFSNHFGLNVHYTFSKSLDEVTDFNSDFSAQNPLNVRLDRSLSAFHQRHRAVFSGVFESPVDGDSALDHVLADWVVSPIFVAGSGRPFNLLLGFDANNDGRSQSDRPFAAGRNTGLGEPFYSFDLRVARRFTFDEHKYLELTFEAFNLFNHTNLLGINNVVGSLPIDRLRELASETASGDLSKAPTQPLGFTSAAAPRQLQFGVRFNF